MTGDVKAATVTEAHESLLAVASLGLVAEHLSQPVFAKNGQLEFVLVNSAFCRLIGRDRDQMLGRRESDVFGAKLTQHHEDQDREVLGQAHPVLAEQAFLASDGTRHCRATTKLPLTDSNGRVTHVVCVVGRAGEGAATAEQVEEELERYAAERTQALKSVQDHLLRKERLMVLGQLAAVLAHQIRNPLGAISNALALARRQLADVDKPMVHEALKIANEEIWEANRIIRDLLDYARIRPPRCSACEIASLVETTLQNEPLPSTVHVVRELNEIVAYVDEQQVRDSLRNLIRNAREAMNDKGTLRLRTRVRGDYAELLVQDSGDGVPPEHRSLLFEPLVTSKPLGIGLGLPTARALIVNQGGTLDCVEPEEPPGACFSMRLPLYQPQEEDNAD